MSRARTSVHLLVRPHPRGVNPLCLLLREGPSARTFHPHIGPAWERLVRPRSGGPNLVAIPRCWARG